MKINNKYINFIFNKLNFVIRFIYSKLWPINIFLRKIMFRKLYFSDFNELDKKFSLMYNFLQDNNIDLKNKVVLELGPGNSYINAYNFLMLGAKKVILVDKFPRYFKTKNQIIFYNKEIDFIKNKYNNKNLFFLDKENNIKKEKIIFLNKELTDTNDLKVDFIYSINVLEHIKKIEQNIIKMNKILEIGGHMYHDIDMRDHYNFNNPFLFYKYSESIWNNFLTKEGFSYTNRWRYDNFYEYFKKNNFEIIKENKKKYKLNNIKINKIFKNYKNLRVGLLTIVLKKNSSIN